MLIGYYTTTYQQLKKAFGTPCFKNETDGYKVSTEWTLKLPGTHIEFYIYDWKATNLYDDPSAPSPKDFRYLNEPYQWHIGGFNEDDFKRIADYLDEMLNPKTQTKEWSVTMTPEEEEDIIRMVQKNIDEYLQEEDEMENEIEEILNPNLKEISTETEEERYETAVKILNSIPTNKYQDTPKKKRGFFVRICSCGKYD